MAITFKSIGTVVYGDNPTIGLPPTYSAGDMLIIVLESAFMGSTPSGWTAAYTNYVGFPLVDIAVFYKIATNSESPVSITAGVYGVTQGVMLAYSGISTLQNYTDNLQDDSVSTTAINGITCPAGSIAIYLVIMSAGAGVSMTNISSANIRLNTPQSPGFGFQIADIITTGSGAPTETVSTSTGTASWSSRTVAFNPAASNTGNFFSIF